MKNGTINNVQITFSLTLHVVTTLFRVKWGLMEWHNPQDRNKEVIVSPRTISNCRGGPKLH
eukprot:scaffold144931_cov70-Attheya_sp.AAC.1